MANFFLIDHSLRNCGGHHFDYVRSVAQAANQLGFHTSIGTNRAFQRQSLNHHDGDETLENVHRIFRDTTYQPDSYLAGLQHLTRSESLRHIQASPRRTRRLSWETLKKFNHQRRRERFVRRFAIDCERFFRSQVQLPGDHAFLTTVSELELMGLAAYLSKFPQTQQTHWHLQFHFNLFEGRTPEYESQEEVLKTVRSCCQAALARLSSHSMHFYTTSEVLVDQYRRLGVGEFQSLPYPISPKFSPQNCSQVIDFNECDLANILKKSESPELAEPASSGPTDLNLAPASPLEFTHPTTAEVGETGGVESNQIWKPLRMTCPGGIRREKGHIEYLQPLVNQIWSKHLATGQVQIVVQRPPKKWHSTKQKLSLEFPGDFESGVPPHASPVEYFSHPLEHDAYVELIKTTDCGLLFYDNRVYYSRRAGVLGELLSCGKPVIVPAGSWLAEQIAEPGFRHVEQIIKNSNLRRRISTPDFGWDRRNVPMPGGVLSFDRQQHPFNFSIERDEQEDSVALEFDWHWPETAGTYCRIELIQRDASGSPIARALRVVGGRRSGRQPNSLFTLEASATRLDFSLTNAFHDSTASIARVSLRMLESPTNHRALGPPIGSVGIIAADQDDLPACVDEMVKHFAHYRASALAYSPRWYAQHDPQMTISHLVSASQSELPSRRETA